MSEHIILQGYEVDFYNRLKSHMDLSGKKILEIGCGRGNLTRTIAEEYPDSFVIGIDPFLKEWWKIDGETEEGNYKILNGDGENLMFPYNSFDLVISVACFEHIANPAKCLSEVKHVLKPGGNFTINFAPIWSSAIGHHYEHWSEKVLRIPPWGHLYMDYNEMYQYLLYTIEEQEAKEICDQIYLSSYINRIDIVKFREIFQNCGLKIQSWYPTEVKNRMLWISGKTKDELTPEIYERLAGRYTKNDLYTATLDIQFEKES